MRSEDVKPRPPQAMTTSALLETLEGCGALRRGHFLLSSGLHSPAYVQCALLLESPARAADAGEGIAALLRGLAPDSVLSPALGGVIIGHEVNIKHGRPVIFCVLTDNTMEQARDRSGGRHGFTVPFAALLPLDLPTYDGADCPLCRAGTQAVKPGSRPQSGQAG